jgi:hypothetical protein
MKRRSAQVSGFFGGVVGRLLGSKGATQRKSPKRAWRFASGGPEWGQGGAAILVNEVGRDWFPAARLETDQ